MPTFLGTLDNFLMYKILRRVPLEERKATARVMMELHPDFQKACDGVCFELFHSYFPRASLLRKSIVEELEYAGISHMATFEGDPLMGYARVKAIHEQRQCLPQWLHGDEYVKVTLNTDLYDDPVVQLRTVTHIGPRSSLAHWLPAYQNGYADGYHLEVSFAEHAHFFFQHHEVSSTLCIDLCTPPWAKQRPTQTGWFLRMELRTEIRQQLHCTDEKDVLLLEGGNTMWAWYDPHEGEHPLTFLDAEGESMDDGDFQVPISMASFDQHLASHSIEDGYASLHGNHAWLRVATFLDQPHPLALNYRVGVPLAKLSYFLLNTS